jgi:hypothetical protein
MSPELLSAKVNRDNVTRTGAVKAVGCQQATCTALVLSRVIGPRSAGHAVHYILSRVARGLEYLCRVNTKYTCDTGQTRNMLSSAVGACITQRGTRGPALRVEYTGSSDVPLFGLPDDLLCAARTGWNRLFARGRHSEQCVPCLYCPHVCRIRLLQKLAIHVNVTSFTARGRCTSSFEKEATEAPAGEVRGGVLLCR